MQMGLVSRFCIQGCAVKGCGGLLKHCRCRIKSIEFFNPATLTNMSIAKDNGMNPLCTHLCGYVTGNWTTARQMNMARLKTIILKYYR